MTEWLKDINRRLNQDLDQCRRTRDRALDEVERLQDDLGECREHYFAMEQLWLKHTNEIERLRKALEYIAGVPHDWSESYNNAWTTCVRVASEALEESE
jgi:chromosome segregation ATPase